MEAGMNAVPGIILDGYYLISGARASRSIWRHTRGAMCLLALLAQSHFLHKRPRMHIHRFNSVNNLLGR